jgi:hypothetical protein
MNFAAQCTGRAALRSWRATWTSLCTRQTSSTSTSSITLTRLSQTEAVEPSHRQLHTTDYSRLLHNWAVWLQLCSQQLSDIRGDGFCYWSRFFLGTFAKLRKAAISHVVSVGLSSRNISVTTGRIFTQFYILVVSEKAGEEIKLSLKCDNNNGWSTWRPTCTYNHENISLNSSYDEKFLQQNF